MSLSKSKPPQASQKMPCRISQNYPLPQKMPRMTHKWQTMVKFKPSWVVYKTECESYFQKTICCYFQFGWHCSRYAWSPDWCQRPGSWSVVHKLAQEPLGTLPFHLWPLFYGTQERKTAHVQLCGLASPDSYTWSRGSNKQGKKRTQGRKYLERNKMVYM